MYFIEPLQLLMLFIPALLLFFSLTNTSVNPQSIFSPRVYQRITLYPNIKHSTKSYRLFLLAINLLILALAQPVISEKSNSQAHFTPLLIALDISPSMAKNDVYPNRFLFAKKKIISLLEENPPFRVSLILFSREAYLAYPMSEDFDSLRYLLKNLHQNLKSGTNLFAALEGAEQILHNYDSKNILLLSDTTSSVEFTQEARYLKENNITLNTLYINKNQKENRTLEKLSQNSGGVFQVFSFGNSDIQLLLHAIKKHSQDRKINPKSTKTSKKIQLFYYPLLLGLMLLLFIFLKKYEFKKIMNSILMLLFFTLMPSFFDLHAGVLEFQDIKKAKDFYDLKEYPKAIQLYKKVTKSKARDYNLASAYYKNAEYQKAIALYKNSLDQNRSEYDAKIYYNIANAYFFLQKLHSAKKYYLISLKIKNDKMAQDNLQNLMQIMKKKKDFHTKEKDILPKTMSSSSKEMPEPQNSNYSVSLNKMVLNEEEKWMKFISKERPLLFLQKLHTTRISHNANAND